MIHLPCGRCAWLLLAVLSMVAAVKGQVVYKRFPGNLQGDVLVLSVNRVPYADGAKVGGLSNIVRSAQDCQDQCTFVSGCQGWTFCSKAGGCGSGCKAYHAKNGPGYLGNAHTCTAVGQYLPILFDSTYVSLSDYKPDPALCSGDAWPQYTCTLKTNITAPKLYSGNQAGWVSGTVTLPPRCGTRYTINNITAWECDTCLKSADPPGCLVCSNQLYTSDRTCGYSRKVYWARPKSSHVKVLRPQTCLACTCYNKPSEAAARNKCFQAAASIGVYQYDSKGSAVDTWSKVMAAAAARCS